MAVAPEMEQYIEAFLNEAREDLALLGACLLRSEASEQQSPVELEEASRAAINLKNAAATMGFRAMRDLAHAIGDLLNGWRRGGARDPGSVPLLFKKAIGLLTDCLGRLEEGLGPEPEVAELVVQLRAVAGDAENLPPETETKTDLAGGQEPAEQGFVVCLRLEEPCPEPLGRFLVCQGYLLELGRVLAAERPAENGPPVLRFLLSTIAGLSQVRRHVAAIPHVRTVEVTTAPPGQDSLPPVRPARKRTGSPVIGRELRVNPQLLGEMDDIAAQLMEIRTGYRALEHELQKANPGAAYRLARLGERFEQPLRRLSEILARLRQVEAEILMQKLSGIAAAQAKVLGREMEIRTAGGETPCGIDQIELLVTPLEQMIRFLLTEDAQEPAERLQAGKARRNRLDLRAEAAEGRLVMRLSLDGRGVLSDTGGTIEEWRARLAECGGILDVQSWPGQGSMFQVEVPLPETWFDVIAMELGKDLFALPLAAVVEARRAAAGEVVWIDGNAYCTWNHETLPLYDLGAILGRPTPEEGRFWLFIGPPEGGYILRVPSVLGSRRVTARHGASLSLPCLNGLCMDSGGQILFLLSPAELAKTGAGRSRRQTPAEVRS